MRDAPPPRVSRILEDLVVVESPNARELALVEHQAHGEDLVRIVGADPRAEVVLLRRQFERLLLAESA